MVLPLIPLAFGAASLLSGAIGLKKGFDAKKTLEEARTIGEKAQLRYKNGIEKLDEKREIVNLELAALGVYKTEIFKKTLGYVVQQVQNAKSSVDGINEQITAIDFREIEILNKELTQISALDISSGSAQGIAAGAAGAFGAYGAVGLIASASTGTAISSLSGAAATNATLAWLGGGSLASGGIGIAGGTWVLGGFVAGPALAIAGYALASKAEEALTKAEEYKAEVDTAIAELEAPKLLLDAIQSNINDTRYILAELVRRFIEVRQDFERHLLTETGWRKWYAKIRGAEYQEKNIKIKEEKLGRIILFGKTIKAVISEPLLSNNGSAISGFSTRISGIIQIDSIDIKNKSCPSCGKEIPVLARTCPECKEIQSTQAQNNKSKSTSNTKLFSKAILATFVLAIALGYWYSQRAINIQQVTLPTSSTESPSPPAPVISPENPPQVNASLIDKILQTKIIGISYQHFETLAGPAKYIDPDNLQRTYEIEGCVIRTFLNDDAQKSIKSLNIKNTSTCNAVLGDFISDESKLIPLKSLTFGNLEKILEGSMLYYSDCLINCGNSYDPSVYLYWSGPRVLNFIEVKAEVVLLDNASIEAAEKWTNYMATNESEDWVLNSEFNCNPEKYYQIASEAFSKIKISSINIGHDLTINECQNR